MAKLFTIEVTQLRGAKYRGVRKVEDDYQTNGCCCCVTSLEY
jgi:hypothetical protein